jgi:GTP-binding protein
MDGEGGADLYLNFPIGTTFIDSDTGEEFELTPDNSPLLLVKGGRGGKGNESFKSSTYRTPKNAEPGEIGKVRHFKVLMKLIADYGFIGLPNAGKSSLLNALTAAHVKTADYPFTTLEPNLGVMNGVVLADIPGLIEGASTGKGLGTKFLKHIEKVKMLLHCISVESFDVEADYATVIKELAAYNPKLMQKERVILLTKIDLISEEEVATLLDKLQEFGKKVIPVSVYDLESLDELKKILK